MTDVYSVDIEITAPVYPTEVPERVEDAITALFPEAEVERRDGEVVGTGHAMERFSERLHEQAILDTARSVFFDTKRGDRFSFALKKQAAFQGVINFAVGEPDELGELHVRVRVNDPDAAAYIDHIAPPTEEGQPVDSRE